MPTDWLPWPGNVNAIATGRVLPDRFFPPIHITRPEVKGKPGMPTSFNTAKNALAALANCGQLPTFRSAFTWGNHIHEV
jgi:hypothetical protein